MRVVLDTNTVVSGFLWDNEPRAMIDAAIDGRIKLFTCAALIEELAGVLPRRKFAKRLAEKQLSIRRTVPRDPDDDAVLACALAADADLIISGNVHLLNLKSYQRIPIVSTTEALARISKTSTGD